MPAALASLFDPRRRPRWRWLLVLLILVTSWFAFTPRPPQLVPGDHDKIQHALAFAALAATAALCGAAGWRQTVAAALGLVAYGGFIEIVQAFLPTRQGEWADLGADTVGIAIGLLLMALLRAAARPLPSPPLRDPR